MFCHKIADNLFFTVRIRTAASIIEQELGYNVLKCWNLATKSFWHGISNSDQQKNTFVMLHNYFKIALRSFFKHRLFSPINLIGLTVGLTICLLIVLFVKDELSYDSFHSKADRILLFQQYIGSSVSGPAFASLLEGEIGQIEKTARLVKTKALIGSQDQSHYEGNFFFADTTIFDLSDLPPVAGNVQTALTASQNLVISESMAQKYFPNENPMGKSLEYGSKESLVISGVIPIGPNLKKMLIPFVVRCLVTGVSEGADRRTS